jgi:GNAT superfamily N-acetyltransferase
MDIRRSTAADFPALGQLLTELGYPASDEEIEARMMVIDRRADFATFVAELDGEVAGMITVSVAPSPLRNDPNGAIVALVVSSAFRGRGIAPGLIAEGEAWLRQQGASRATVNPSIQREPAHRLYSRLGYEHTGLRLSKMLAAAP